MSEDKIELTEEMANTLDNPPKANDAFKAAAKKYKGEDIKMADGSEIGNLMRSASNELNSYILAENERLARTVHSGMEAPPDYHDQQTCYELQMKAKVVDTLTQQVAELRAALEAIKGYQKAITPSGYKLSSAWQIASKAIELSE